MIVSSAIQRVQKMLAARLNRKPAYRPVPTPMISFTFDDFPRSAVDTAGKMLDDQGVKGTYYAALGMMSTKTVVGEIFEKQDLERLVSGGHELACHTFNHVLCSTITGPELLINCESNRARIAEVVKGYHLENFSFPEGVVTTSAKAALNSVYRTCRTIEPGINRDPTDLGFLRANPVYSRPSIDRVKKLIQRNERDRGWLILYTHDVRDNPSPYGCTPRDFREVLECAARSGAEILSVSEAAKRFSPSNA